MTLFSTPDPKDTSRCRDASDAARLRFLAKYRQTLEAAMTAGELSKETDVDYVVSLADIEETPDEPECPSCGYTAGHFPCECGIKGTFQNAIILLGYIEKYGERGGWNRVRHLIQHWRGGGDYSALREAEEAAQEDIASDMELGKPIHP